MAVEPPSPDKVREVFPQIAELTLLKVGGFKVVYRARTGGATEAFKLVRLPTLGADDVAAAFRQEVVGRVRREIDILGACGVPEMVHLGSISPSETVIDGNDYVAYSEEYLSGRDLWDLMRNTRTTPDERELRILFLCLLRAIRELWSRGYVHRDIKPVNVMKTDDPHRPFVLLDLGIAYSITETALTYNPGDRLPPATYRYIAPEMANPRFRETLDYRSDLYCAALTVYEYAARKHPLARSDDDLIQTITRAVLQPAVPLERHRSDLSPEFCALINQMLRKKPALRPSNLGRLMAVMEEGA